MQAKTIDEVISILDKIVDECKATNNPLGYFAILYRQVTINVRDGILNNHFEDNARMEKLDVHFANRYFEAYFNYKIQQPISKSWAIAFASSKRELLILQYLLQGINAHINLDLGIATIKTLDGNKIETIKNDFDGINNLLSQMIDEVKDKISSLSPMFKLLMPLAKRWDHKLVQFSIETARDGAWEFANQLYNNPSNFDLLFNERDKKINVLGTILVSPPRFLGWILNIILFFETGSVKSKMEVLEKKVQK